MCRFDLTEFYAKELGPKALPREWYLIPADVHLDAWYKNLHYWPSYSTSFNSKVDSWLGQTWPGQTNEVLEGLYRRSMAIVSGNYPSSNFNTPPPQPKPCAFVGPCLNSSQVFSLRSAVCITGMSGLEASLWLYDGLSCDDMRLGLVVKVIMNITDSGKASKVSQTLYVRLLDWGDKH